MQDAGIELMASSQQPKPHVILVHRGAREGSWAGMKGDLKAGV